MCQICKCIPAPGVEVKAFSWIGMKMVGMWNAMAVCVKVHGQKRRRRQKKYGIGGGKWAD